MIDSRTIVAAIMVASACPGLTLAGCKVLKMAELPVTMVNMKPVITARINGAQVRFVADSGAFFSMISAASAAELKLRTILAPMNLWVRGIGGSTNVSIATVKAFELTGFPQPIHDIEFLVGGGEVGGDSVGVLGQNVFRVGDVEYDLANGVIRLMREEGCSKVNLAYWTAGTSQASSDLEVQATTPVSPHTTGVAVVNGVKIHVLFDTGASTSILSRRAAERAGVKINSPGVVEGGYYSGIGREKVKTWIAPFASFKLGDEEIRNTRLRIGDSVVDSTDMLIGADFFLSHRIYVSTKQHRLFFTYNGGAVFNLKTQRPVLEPAAAGTSAGTGTNAGAGAGTSGDTGTSSDTGTSADARTGTSVGAGTSAGAGAGISTSADAGTSAGANIGAGIGSGTADAGSVAIPSGEPKSAAEFSQRGTAFAARRDFVQAIADLTRACALSPEQPDYFYERGIVYWKTKALDLAVADFSQAIKLKPDDVPAIVARAELELQTADAKQATQDLDAADRYADKAADVRLRMAYAYMRADGKPAAVVQLDQWIAAHGDDVRLPNALSERCWARALLGQNLPKALDDCNSAFKHTDATDPGRARILSARGLVRLRLGDYDKSITDYDAALAIRPKDAWGLYGRGVAKRRRGKADSGQADMAAASAAWPQAAETFEKRGIDP